MARRVIPHWYDWRLILGITFTPIVVGLALVPFLPLIQQSHSSEAKGAMLATPAPIDGKRAFGYLEKICEIGPRVAGSEANTPPAEDRGRAFHQARGQGPGAALPLPASLDRRAMSTWPT